MCLCICGSRIVRKLTRRELALWYPIAALASAEFATADDADSPDETSKGDGKQDRSHDTLGLKGELEKPSYDHVSNQSGDAKPLSEGGPYDYSFDKDERQANRGTGENSAAPKDKSLVDKILSALRYDLGSMQISLFVSGADDSKPNLKIGIGSPIDPPGRNPLEPPGKPREREFQIELTIPWNPK